ncbi:sulfotransferase [Ferrimonas balearica DSM 9799]|uniref:Sulfotransferase n=1 Tax=Ferrimonas balearica (strain DSM 9799 / CCM 4581 / KCTC 23876 / PAT) TaxID=550540 RepID=E1SVJ3_FERBD|nr:tetratricopeptide repeat-containing sulfotransferase family protein [Ferrimonas balearica]ADN75339.1 sulfotransferase [Ferrimonas balearica DSM 9799]
MTQPIDGLIQQAEAALKGGDIPTALTHTQQVLSEAPEHRQGLYLAAVCHRYLKQWKPAERHLTRLLQLDPHYGRAHQEQGHTLLAQGKLQPAADAYRHAVSQNPALVASWAALARLAQHAGDGELAQRALAHHQHFKALPPTLVTVNSLLHEGKLLKAEQLCRSFLQQHPSHIEAMRLLAQLAAKLNVLDDAEVLLDSALQLEPGNRQVRFDLVQVLHRRQKYAESLLQAETLRDSEPGNPSFDTAYANQLVAVGRFDEALALYDQVLAKLPDNANLHLVKGHALKTLGRQPEAIEAYQASYRHRPGYGDACWSLANLKTYRFSDAELSRMQQDEAAPGRSVEDRFHLCFALGKALEDRGQFEQAFDYYARGNQLKQSQSRYRPESMARDLKLQAQHINADLVASKAGLGCTAPDPIFIVGMPRAGSTLLEQIIASHPQVDGTMELPDIAAMAHRLNGRRRVDEAPAYPANLVDLDGDTLRQMGQQYLDQTRIHRQGAPRFIDKMPNNFRHIGLIKLILPNAKIIDARRDPMACCFSNFKQLFAEGQEFSYSLDNMAAYYRGYERLMAHFDQVFPGQILRVQYEDVVADLEQQVSRILDYLELPFDERCLAFHKTQRSVRTASSEQVRQPLYRSGLEQWRNFETQLAPLERALAAY